ncbi:hypothetical protein ACOALA_20820 (plasmid) [Alicyclobacillus acidoterrestris]|uniref:hypothetical protein n=1 Tax=Alicyclobacillus acidoterrestris TaxID=1450 RepID=UPI003F534B68
MNKRTAKLRVDLYKLILRHGYKTMSEFAHDLGVSPSTLSMLAHNKSGGSRALRTSIARKLGKKPEDIWSGV